MARTPSTMLELGTPAPGFSLPDFDGRVHALRWLEELEEMTRPGR